MSIEVQNVKVGQWYQAIAGQYRRVVNLDTDGKVTYELFDHCLGTSNTQRVSVELFANSVNHETQAPVMSSQ